MSSRSIEDALEILKENVESELVNEGLASWSINTSGLNITEQLGSLSLSELKNLRDEIIDGESVEITIDLSDAVLSFVEEVIDEREAEDDDDSSEEEDEFESWSDDED